VLKVGQEVQVKVISVDRERKRIGLSIRQTLDDPWIKHVAHLKEGQLIVGKITHLTKFGAFARLSEELEGLIHLSELSEQRINHPKEVVKEGDEVTLRIIKIEPERHRIGLSLRRVDSPAYADLDWKMALAGEVREAHEGEEKVEPEAPAEAEAEAKVEAATEAVVLPVEAGPAAEEPPAEEGAPAEEPPAEGEADAAARESSTQES
ncbi:MAG: S1 RNA-binding domain-containing protein, partial [Anaerolineales bacterium]|nr:S1 RNA-binding domain-containing protein [Anaerolineales bacterium]